MTSRDGGSGEPAISRSSAAIEQLANLRAGAGAAGPGNQRGVSHGAYARISERELEGKVREVYDAVSADAPVRANDGSLPAHDSIAVRLLAETLIRRERVAAEELAHGIEIASGPRKGELRRDRAVRVEAR